MFVLLGLLVWVEWKNEISEVIDIFEIISIWDKGDGKGKVIEKFCLRVSWFREYSVRDIEFSKRDIIKYEGVKVSIRLGEMGEGLIC